jgi:CHAT domain-containing protein
VLRARNETTLAAQPHLDPSREENGPSAVQFPSAQVVIDTEPAALGALWELAEMRHRNPSAALQHAQELLERLPAQQRERALAEWVVGLAYHELGQPKAAVKRFKASVRLARRHGWLDCEALAHASMAISVLGMGDSATAGREIADATLVATRRVNGVVSMLQGLVQQRTGKLDEALATYGRALRSLRRTGDSSSIARLLLNRGILRAYQGDFRHAVRDLTDAEDLATRLQLWVLVAMAAHNTGFVHGRQGNLATALAAFDRARHAYGTFGNPPRLVGVLEADRCEVLLAAALASDARAAAAAALAALQPVGDIAHLTETRLLLARACLAQGDHAAAIAEATAAAKSFRRCRMLPWAALAEYVSLQAEVAITFDGATPRPQLLGQARRIVTKLEAQGWGAEALHVRTFIGRLALESGRTQIARAELAGAATARARGAASLRAQAWHATALLHVVDGDNTSAKRALRRGMKVIEEHRSTLAATELRAQAATHGSELARLGVRIALRERRPVEVFSWAERWRARALELPPIRPPDDLQTATDLAELRRLHGRARDATLGGERADQLHRDIGVLEESVRARVMRTCGEPALPADSVADRQLRSELGPWIVVEYVELDGLLHAVTVSERETNLHSLGHLDTIEQEKQHLLFALRRLITASARPCALEAAERGLDAAACELDAQLLGALSLPPAAPVVVVPTGALHGLPWGCLPSLAGRPTTVAPSAALWRRHNRHDTRTVRRDRVLLVAGPDLTGAQDEISRLAQLYPEARVLTGRRATGAAVLEAIEQADLVHIAAHGNFRADSPLFSSLTLADGPVTVYDLERLRSAPAVMVLSACNAAVADVRTGDELLGTATALLSVGVGCVIAPVVPVPDDATTEFMLSLHQRLCASASPSTALALAAVESRRRGGSHDLAAATSFICLGTKDGTARPLDAAEPSVQSERRQLCLPPGHYPRRPFPQCAQFAVALTAPHTTAASDHRSPFSALGRLPATFATPPAWCITTQPGALSA